MNNPKSYQEGKNETCNYHLSISSSLLVAQGRRINWFLNFLTDASALSSKDYGIYFVSHFAYLLKGMERNGLIIQHWQSMVWNRSRIVYKGRYLNQNLISSTVLNLGFLKRRPWQYDAIDEFLSEIGRLKGCKLTPDCARKSTENYPNMLFPHKKS